RPRLGAQGDGREPLGVPLRRGRPQVFPPLVLLGDPLAAPAHDREGADAQDAPAEHPHLPAPPDHQRDGRRLELEDPVDPVHRPRLPQPGELQDGDLLPLRRPRPLPTLKPEEPEILRESHVRGYAEFDFLIGGELYKWHYATQTRVIGPLGTPPLS